MSPVSPISIKISAIDASGWNEPAELVCSEQDLLRLERADGQARDPTIGQEGTPTREQAGCRRVQQKERAARRSDYAHEYRQVRPVLSSPQRTARPGSAEY